MAQARTTTETAGGGALAGAAAGGAVIGDAAPAEAPADWRDGIPDGKMREFAERFASPAEVARAAFEFRQKLSNAVVVPGKDASADDVRAFHRRIGVPDGPEGYDVALPDVLPGGLAMDGAGRARVDAFLKAMHAAGAPRPVVQAALDTYFGMVADEVEGLERAGAEARQAVEAELTKEWGGEYARNMNVARRAAAELGGERFARFLEATRVGGAALGDHPEFIRAFAAAGRLMGEDAFHLGEPGERGASIQGRIDELLELMHADPEKYKSDAVQGELRELHERLYGTDPIVGVDGRKA